jgi:hypothetical protein
MVVHKVSPILKCVPKADAQGVAKNIYRLAVFADPEAQ